MIPESLKKSILDVTGLKAHSATPLGGGSINNVAIVESDKLNFVLKWNSPSLFSMFEVEAQGLDLLRKNAENFIVPEVFGMGKSDAFSWLAISKIENAPTSSTMFKKFGESLAALHKNHANSWGLNHHNYIGRLPQPNTTETDWLTFFRKQRIEFQLKMAVDSGKMQASSYKRMEQMFLKLPEIIPDEPPSLLHGDLWSGNFIAAPEDKTALIDPAVYYGHREIEIAFTRLFGGFSPVFYDAYHNSYPLQPGFESRVDIYNLYPLLVHVNLFGGGYVGQAQSVLNKF